MSMTPDPTVSVEHPAHTPARGGVQLITYIDRLGGDAQGLKKILGGPLRDVFDGYHLLPFYTPYDGADAGFDPADHTQVDPRLGTWIDVKDLALGKRLMADMIVNHVSYESPAFQDVLVKGAGSEYLDMFLTMTDVFPEGATEEALAAIYRPRPGLPFTPMTIAGHKRLMWTTFTPQQLDVNIASDGGRAYLDRVLTTLISSGVDLLRLDAVGYAVKTAGTSSFMTPETFEFIDELTARARSLGAQVLVEIHSHYQRQIAIASKVDMVYDFALPPLLLHSMYTGDAAALRHWLSVRPVNAVTVLDTHDGIGVVDVGPDQIDADMEGLLTPEQVHDLVEGIHEHSGGQSRQATGWAASNVDVYQVNSTYYSALGCHDSAYLICRAVQFFTPGIPQVYYVGLLAGANDMDLLARTGVGRDINRHYYTPEEIEAQCQRPVVDRLIRLIRFRNAHPAFNGEFTSDGEGSRVRMRWERDSAWAELEVDCAATTARITSSPTDGVDDEWVQWSVQ